MRIIPSRFPPVPLFERIGDPSEWEALSQLESLTNPRLRDAVASIRMIPPEDRGSGPCSRAIMAAFTHQTPDGTRITDIYEKRALEI